jgi:membrane-associated phospholipid phosphatase
MIPLLKKNAFFFLPYLIFLCLGGIVLTLHSTTDIHLFINAHHSPAADFFFTYCTDIGLGIMIIPLLFILAFVRFRYMVISLIGFLMATIVNDSLKAIFHAPRPITVFGDLHQSLYLVPGIEMYSWNSFPSGHTATGFCMFCLLAIYIHNKPAKFLCLVVALLIGYSRMYLSEHFFKDVYAASMVGVASALAAYYLVMHAQIFNKFAERLDTPLISIRRKP